MIQTQRNGSASPTTSSSELLTARIGAQKRTQLIITNTHATSVVTIAKGDAAAVAGQGIVLQPKQAYVESTDGGYECWQGAVQIIADAAATVAFSEGMVVQ